MGVFAGRSQQTATGRGNRLLELAGKVAPVAFVFGYLFILAVFMHRVVPQFTIAAGRRNPDIPFLPVPIEARMRSAAARRRVGGAAAEDGLWQLPWSPGAARRSGRAAGAIGGLLLIFASVRWRG